MPKSKTRVVRKLRQLAGQSKASIISDDKHTTKTVSLTKFKKMGRAARANVDVKGMDTAKGKSLSADKKAFGKKKGSKGSRKKKFEFKGVPAKSALSF